MIRMFLFALGFIAITVGLLVFQPGAPQRDPFPLVDDAVTRAEPALALQEIPVQPAPPPAPPSPPQSIDPITTGPLDADALRRMSWETLSALNQATGRASAPGQPGSLLHSIVQKSLESQTPPPPTPVPETYVVQPGDSLVGIAQKIYQDVNMTGPLFATNQSILSAPEDLQAGQVLVLPQR